MVIAIISHFIYILLVRLYGIFVLFIWLFNIENIKNSRKIKCNYLYQHTGLTEPNSFKTARELPNLLGGFHVRSHCTKTSWIRRNKNRSNLTSKIVWSEGNVFLQFNWGRNRSKQRLQQRKLLSRVMRVLKPGCVLGSVCKTALRRDWRSSATERLKAENQMEWVR